MKPTRFPRLLFHWLLVWIVSLGCSAPVLAQGHTEVALRVDRVAIYVEDLALSASFYERLFGFKNIPAPVSFARWLETGNGVVLHIVGGRKEPISHVKWVHLALVCHNMPDMISKLNAQQIPWTDLEGRPQEQIRSDGIKQIFVRDPDGYWIEINDVSKR